jgi:hypothetical protein
MNAEQEISLLRSQGLTPKAIARRLGLRPAEVAEIVRAHAVQSIVATALPTVVGSLVSNGWSSGLTLRDEAEKWRALDHGDAGSSEGLVSVLWAREHRYDKVVVSGCLIDTYCLGVKNAIPPRTFTLDQLRGHVDVYFSRYSLPPVSVPFELLQSLVFGAVDYARSLGFEPHPDFERVRPQLGDWTGPSPIVFGRNGRPYFVAGPNDDAAQVIGTLRRAVGDDQFDFIAPLI